MGEEIICSRCGKATDKQEMYCVHCGYFHQLDHYDYRPVKLTGSLSTKKSLSPERKGRESSNVVCYVVIGLIVLFVLIWFFAFDGWQTVLRFFTND
jgi:ribosomal protein L37E